MNWISFIHSVGFMNSAQHSAAKLCVDCISHTTLHFDTTKKNNILNYEIKKKLSLTNDETFDAFLVDYIWIKMNLTISYRLYLNFFLLTFLPLLFTIEMYLIYLLLIQQMYFGQLIEKVSGNKPLTNSLSDHRQKVGCICTTTAFKIGHL